jgi:hypothetical protein
MARFIWQKSSSTLSQSAQGTMRIDYVASLLRTPAHASRGALLRSSPSQLRSRENKANGVGWGADAALRFDTPNLDRFKSELPSTIQQG